MSNLPDAPLAEPAHPTVTIRVARAAGGGWDVIAMVDQFVLETQHCADWHRAERVYQRMKADTEDDRLVMLTRETIEALLAV